MIYCIQRLKLNNNSTVYLAGYKRRAGVDIPWRYYVNKKHAPLNDYLHESEEQAMQTLERHANPAALEVGYTGLIKLN